MIQLSHLIIVICLAVLIKAVMHMFQMRKCDLISFYCCYMLNEKISQPNSLRIYILWKYLKLRSQ